MTCQSWSGFAESFPSYTCQDNVRASQVQVNGKQIRVIKRAEHSLSRPRYPDQRRRRLPYSLKETRRDAVTIVTGWVSELRKRKAKELAHGFQSLFGKVT